MFRFRSRSFVISDYDLATLVLMHARSLPSILVEVNSKDWDTFPADYRSWTSVLFRGIPNTFKNLRIKQSHTTNYHPQCNGMIERLHGSIKISLKMHNQINGKFLKNNRIYHWTE